MTAKETLRLILPPFLWRWSRHLKRRLLPSDDGLTYVASGWATPLPEAPDSQARWNAFMANQRLDTERSISGCLAGNVLASSPDNLLGRLLFGYAVALTARANQPVAVLDYGGSLGEYYWLCRAAVPGIEVEYHCKERPAVAAVGREVTPNIIWHTDDDCLDRPYDLIVFCSSLQYLPDWQEVLRRAARSTRGYLLVSDAPVVRQVDGYVAIQRLQGTFSLYQPLNCDALIATLEEAGLHLVHEVDMGPHPPIENAPEQPVCVGWLFERRPTSG